MEKPAKVIDQVIPCENLDETLNHYIETLGYKLECIFPADSPKAAIVFKGESRIQLGAENIMEIKVPPVKYKSASAKVTVPFNIAFTGVPSSCAKSKP